MAIRRVKQLQSTQAATSGENARCSHLNCFGDAENRYRRSNFAPYGLINARAGEFDLIHHELLNKMVLFNIHQTPIVLLRTRPLIECFAANEKTNGRKTRYLERSPQVICKRTEHLIIDVIRNIGMLL